MSTPGGIGVYLSSGPAPARVNERPWRGVYHHYDGQPESLGQELIKRARLFKGNLGGLVRQVIDSAPEGWVSLAQQEQMEDGMTVGPDDTGNITYAFVFDVGARRLDAFATHSNANGEFIGSVSFDAGGVATPAEFEVIEPPSPKLTPQVVQTWEPFDEKARAIRLDVRRRVERDCGPAGLTVQGLVTLISQALSDAFFQADWEKKRAPAPLTRVIIAGDRTAWSVKLGALEVLYPTPDARRGLIRTNAEGDETLIIGTPENEWAELDVRRSTITRSLGEGGKKVYDVLISALPASDWLFAFLDLARGLVVPETAASVASPTELPWRVLKHPDGRVWAIRPAPGRYLLRLGARDDDPVFKERPCTRPDSEVDKLIKEQLSEGFVPQPDEPV